MPTYLLYHEHRPEECAIAIAAWKGFASPLRGGRPLGSCHVGGHQLWWVVEAPASSAALAQLPSFVADRTAVDQVTEVQIPWRHGRQLHVPRFLSLERSCAGSSGRSGPARREAPQVGGPRHMHGA